MEFNSNSSNVESMSDEHNQILGGLINPSYHTTGFFTRKEDAVQPPPPAPPLESDKGRIERCFVNICKIWKFFFPKSIEGKRTGTIVSSVLVLLNSCLGGGILAVPFGFMSSGMVVGTSFTIFFGLLGAFTMVIVCYALIYAEQEDNKTLASYQDFIEHYLGYWMKKISEVILALYMAGACIGYLTIIGDSFQPVLTYYVEENSPFFFLVERKLIISFFSMLIVFPLSLLRTTKSLDVASFFSNFGVVILCVIVVIKSSVYLSSNPANVSKDIFFFNSSLFYSEIPQCFLAIPIIAFAYQCHVIIVPIISELQNPTFFRCLIIIVVAFTTIMTLNSFTGMFGLLQFGNGVNADILLSYPGDSPLAIFGRVIIGLVATLTYPVIFFNDRLAFTTLLFQYGKIKKIVFEEKIDPRTRTYVLKLKTVYFLILSLVMFIITLSIALIVPNIVIAFGFIGSVGSVTLMLTLPSVVFGWFIYNKFLVTFPLCFRICGLILPALMVLMGLLMMTVGVLVTAWKIRATS